MTIGGPLSLLALEKINGSSNKMLCIKFKKLVFILLSLSFIVVLLRKNKSLMNDFRLY